MQLSYRLLEREYNLTPANCSSGTWRSGVVDFSSQSADGPLTLIARHGSNNGNSNIVEDRIDIIKDTQAPTLSFNSTSGITNENMNTYQVSGTCNGASHLNVFMPDGSDLQILCKEGSWSTEVLDVYYYPIGTLPLSARIEDDAGNGLNLETSIQNNRKLYLRYIVKEARTYSRANPKNLPNNYLGKIYIPLGYRGQLSRLTISELGGGTYTGTAPSRNGRNLEGAFYF